MKIIPFVHEGLGNSSYLVGLDGGDAVLVDPDRSVQRYIVQAEQLGWRISAVLETHLHADFVSGARELAAREAALYIPEGAQVRFSHQPVAPGQKLQLGGAQIEIIASPGHTPEHLSYVLRSDRQPPLLFSGGALIVGGAARTDLISPEMTEPLTRSLFQTLQNAFAPLPDETALYPTHGGGSFCSTGSSSRRVSTLGEERASNPLLAVRDEEEFLRWFPSTFPAVPAYFFRMRAVNQQGPRLRRDIPDPPALPPADFAAASKQALVVDARPMQEYLAAHIPGAFANPLRDAYATWLGWLVPEDIPLLFVTGGVSLRGVIDESLLVGYERFAGWLEGGIQAWQRAGLELASTSTLDAAAARKAVLDGVAIVDVREPNEFAAGHLEGAVHLPLGKLEQELDRVPRDRPVLAYCGHGERSTSAISLLERAGIGPLLMLKGGVGAWTKAGYPLSR
ncbi:MAG TPA: rhodanese-like domain-containing protein [Dehalococcoidia bacterium]|nr:rhodanese-like domain-containing protein [Dehalococcoidia bacterium]